uniref:Caspase-3 n=1 Tax=Eptatretus burgeri TaxID=7764 RepID=A0A8C4N5Z9_EPTBU
MDQRTVSVMENEGLSLCLIINNMEFKLCLKARNGAEEDNSKLKECFMKLGFHVVIKRNQTCEEMKKVLKENSKQDHSKRTCFVCVLMSHGDNGNIFATDGEIDIQELISEFYEDCHPSLKEKPKLFFIQACRGEYFDTGKEAKSMGETSLSQLEPAFLFNKERVYPGFLLAYATPQGFVAHRSKCRGSHFIQQMCKQFMKEFDSATGQDILHQLTHVHRDISNTDFNHFDCCTFSNIRMKQIPSFFSTLNENFLWKKVDQKAVAETPYIITQHKRCVIINIIGKKCIKVIL